MRYLISIAIVVFVILRTSGADAQTIDDTRQRLDAIEQRLQRIEQALLAQGTPQSVSPFAGLNLTALQDLQERSLVSTGGGMPPAAEDSDHDGLTNAEEGLLGTNPNNPDTDGDALLDGWEIYGVNGIDLRALGANPLRKDIFVEMDYMVRSSATKGLGPNTAVLDGIRQVFSDAPVLNPDGSTGISIHLEEGNEVPWDDDLNPPASELAALKNTHFDERRLPVFHYMIWADRYNGGTSSGNSFAIPNSDFIVTLGGWSNNTGGTDEQKIGTFIHELGHNLGLRHGGSDHTGFKPNHLSVMNYSFQTIGVLVGTERRFSYQPFALPPLDERSLLESAGLGGASSLADYHTRIRTSSSFRELVAAGSIDWSGNGSFDTNPVTFDLNRDFTYNELLATPNEWTSLVFDGGAIGSTQNLGLMQQAMNQSRQILPQVELTEEMSLQFQGN